MSSDTRAVVPGEASETDSDDDGLAQESVNTNSAKGVVVQGEASETDSDDDKVNEDQVKPVTEKGAKNLSIHGDIPTLKVEQGSLNKESPSSPDTVSVSSLSFTTREGLGVPKYDTLIHHKLRDKNAALLMNIHNAVGGSLNDVSKTVHMANQQMNKSQVIIQDVCQLIRNFCKDLDLVNQKLDVINSTQYIPSINIPAAPTENAGPH